MPVFDIQCEECGSKFMDKYFTSLISRDDYTCPDCGGYTKALLPNRLMINMDSTCAGWDPVMEVELRGNSHRKLEMAKRGWEERGDTPLSRTDKGKWI